MGRLGLFLNMTADLGHIGTKSNWTLELTAVQPLRIYPGMVIGQVSFWRTDDSTRARYRGRYLGDRQPTANRDLRLVQS
jgi:dCTP deaminase